MMGVYVVGVQGYSAHMREHARERRPSVQRSLQPFLDDSEVGGLQHHFSLITFLLRDVRERSYPHLAGKANLGLECNCVPIVMQPAGALSDTV